MLTLDSTLSIKLGAEHPQPEDQHHKGKEYPKAEANTPDSGKVIFSGNRKRDEEYGRSQRATELMKAKILWLVHKQQLKAAHGEDKVCYHEEHYTKCIRCCQTKPGQETNLGHAW